jgi:hypothetical protein
MHDRGDVASDALVAILAGIFRIAEEGAAPVSIRREWRARTVK